MANRAFPRITGLNSNGNPERLIIMMNRINKSDNCNDIFVINDIRLQPTETDKVNLLNHNITINNDETNGHLPGGCALITPKDCFVTELPTSSREALLCRIQRKNKAVIVGTHYAHAGNAIDEELVINLATASLNCPGILVGDFNAPLRSFGSNSDSANGETLRVVTESHGLKYVKNKINTRINNIRGDDNVLDMFFINDKAEEIFDHLTVDDPVGSDHLPITLHMDTGPNNDPIVINKIDDQRLATEMDLLLDDNPASFDETTALHKSIIDKEIETFTSILLESRTRATKLITIKTKNGIPLSSETTKLIAERRRLIHKRSRQRGNITPEEKARCNHLDRQIKKHLKTDECAHFKHKGERIIAERNPKKRWKKMNEVMQRNKKSNAFKALTKTNGEKCESREENVEVHAD